jgi:hypothetical protein
MHGREGKKKNLNTYVCLVRAIAVDVLVMKASRVDGLMMKIVGARCWGVGVDKCGCVM